MTSFLNSTYYKNSTEYEYHDRIPSGNPTSDIQKYARTFSWGTTQRLISIYHGILNINTSKTPIEYLNNTGMDSKHINVGVSNLVGLQGATVLKLQE